MNFKNFFLGKAVFMPLINISKDLDSFLLLGSVFSFALVVLANIFGHTFVCFADNTYAANCEMSIVRYFIYLLLKIFLISVFSFLWYQKVYENKTIDEKFLIQNWRGYVRTFFVWCVLLGLNLLPFISLMFLTSRVPNPNWIIELCYFTFFFILIWIPFILLPMYGVAADIIGGYGFKNLSLMWKNSRGSTLQILLSALFVFLFCVLVLFSAMNSLKSLSFLGFTLYDFISEFGFSFISLFVIAIAINYFVTIRSIFLHKLSQD